MPTSIYFLIGFVISSAFSARILGIMPIPSYSHQVVFQPLWKELSLRGHQVTVLTTNPIKDPLLTNLTEVDMSFSYPTFTKTNMAEFSNMSIFAVMDTALKLMQETFAEQFEYLPIKNLIANETEHFDVVLAEGLFSAPYAFSTRFKCPLIAVTTLDSPSRNYKLLGNPVHPAINPDFILPFSGKLNFMQRFVSVVWSIYETFVWSPKMLASQQELVDKYFGNHYPRLSEIEQNISAMFVNADSVFHRIRARLPNIIEVGGGIHMHTPKPLPTDLKRQLDEAKQGFIYFSLGSNVKSKDLSEDKRRIIIDTFSELPYLVLWKFELDNLPDRPSNVIISKWFPQQDIFRHPNIKLFITQGGLQSTDEAIHNHLSILCIPFMGDQQKNAQDIVEKGIGLMLDIHTLNKVEFKASILELLKNPKYKNNVIQLANLIEDLPMTGLEKAIWWTEYVIRYKGAKHLRSPAMDLPSYQYFLLDIIGFTIVVVGVTLFLVVKFIRSSVKVLKRKFGSEKIKSE